MVLKLLSVLVIFVHFCTADGDMPEDVRGVVEIVSPNFENNLRERFTGDLERYQRRSKELITIKNELNFDNDQKLELSHLTMVNFPDVRLVGFKLDLYKLYMKVKLHLDKLNVGGDFRTNNLSDDELFPNRNKGKIAFDFQGITCEGMIGLNVEEDSFIIKDHDLQFFPSEINMTAIYNDEQGQKVERRVTKSDVDQTIAASFWPDVEQYIWNRYLFAVFAEIVDFSYSETMLDESSVIDGYRKYATDKTKKANHLIEALLPKINEHVAHKNGGKVAINDFRKSFQNALFSESNSTGEFLAKNGHFTDLSKLKRASNFTIVEDAQKLLLFGALRSEEYSTFGFEYEAKFDDQRANGSIKMEMYRDKIFVKISVTKTTDPYLTKLESVQMRDLESNTVDVNDLDPLIWLKDDIDSWTLAHVRNAGVKAVKTAIEEALTAVLNSTDLKALL